MCGITKTRVFPGKQKEPSLSKGTGLFGDIASTVGLTFIRKGVPNLSALNGAEAGRH